MRSRLLLCLAGILLVVAATATAADRPVYADSLEPGWDDWSWNTTVNFSNASPVHGGAASIQATYTGAWAGLYLNTDDPVTGAQFDRIRFWIHGGTSGGQNITFMTYDTAYQASAGVTVTPTANTWTLVEITAASLGQPPSVQGLVWQESSGGAQPAFYIDDITLVTSTAPPAVGTATVAVDVSAQRHAISPYVYGMNFADEALADELALPVRRRGGNSTTRYNWQNDTSNRAMDWYFENIPEDNSNPGALPDGSASDRFVEQDRRTGTKSIITVPLIGWTPKSRAYAGGYSVAKYGAQQSVDPWRDDFGNGILTNGTPITWNDPADTSAAIGPQFVKDWIAHLAGRYGTAAAGGVLFYNLDNEPMLWDSTHHDVHPQPTSYDEMLTRTVAYAQAVKEADPAAQTLGPVLWGWTAYFYSALDAAAGRRVVEQSAGPQCARWNAVRSVVPAADAQPRADQRHAHSRLSRPALLPAGRQSGAVRRGPRGHPGTAAALHACALGSRLHGRELDRRAGAPHPAHARLGERQLPRHEAGHDGVQLGRLDHINGALAQADVLGIFGREGLDLATLWGPPTSTQPGAFAFRMYRNYDGAGAAFGETSVQAAASDQGRVAAYAARRALDQALTLMLINKTSEDIVTTVTLSGFPPAATAAVYRYSAANLNAVVRQPDHAVAPGGFTATVPAASITLVVIAQSLAGDTVAPVVASVATVTHNDVDITFTEANGMGASALNTALYTISGSGRNGLAAHPDSVMPVWGNTYRLHWNSGGTATGGAVTITGSSAILDAAGNPLGMPNSATDTSAVPVTLTEFEIAGSSGMKRTTAFPL